MSLISVVEPAIGSHLFICLIIFLCLTAMRQGIIVQLMSRLLLTDS